MTIRTFQLDALSCFYGDGPAYCTCVEPNGDDDVLHKYTVMTSR
jgi:hypothetical protein